MPWPASPEDGAGVDDGAAGHERDDGPRQVEDALDGDVVEPVPVLFRAVQDAAAHLDPGVVVQRVHPAQHAPDLARGGGHLVPVDDVAGAEQGPASQGADSLRRLLAAHRVDVEVDRREVGE